MFDGLRSRISKADEKLSRSLAICGDEYYIYCKGSQLMRFVSKGTQPVVWMVWLPIWMLATREVSVHERLFNTFIGSAIGLVLCCIIKTIFKRARPPVTTGGSTPGLGQYSFPSGEAMLLTLASCVVGPSYNNDFVVVILMKVLILVVCLSMVMLGRQYVMDTVGGILIGYLTYQLLVRYVWVSASVSDAYVRSMQTRLHI